MTDQNQYEREEAHYAEESRKSMSLRSIPKEVISRLEYERPG